MYIQMLTPRVMVVYDTFVSTESTEVGMQNEIKRRGNSAAVRLPSKILAQTKLDVSSPISINVKAGKIVIEAVQKSQRKVNLPFSEADLLEGLDSYGAHADEIAQPSANEMGD